MKNKQFYDMEYLRTLNIVELKFLTIFLENDSLVKQIINEKNRKKKK